MSPAKIYTKGELRDIPHLLISEDGTLVTTDYIVKNRFSERIIKGKVLKTRPRNSRVSYLEFSHMGVKYLLHRVLTSTFKEIKVGCNEVRHLDDNIYNNNLENLEWGTRKENAVDACNNGKILSGRFNENSFIVQMFHPSGYLIKELCGKKEIQESGLWQSNVHKACRSGKPYKGFIFKTKE